MVIAEGRWTKMNDVAVNDVIRHETLWICEKWSEDAVDFARRKLQSRGIDHTLGALQEVRIRADGSIIHVPRLLPIHEGISSMALREIVGPPEECAEIKGNLLLNEGIQRMLDLTMIATVTNNQTAGNPWANSNAQLGVGDSSAAEAATQTELQAATNRFYAAMNATYPSRSNQTVSFQTDFTTSNANYAWNEWTVATGSSGSPPSGTINLNRKVASLGTKASGTWTLTAQITFS